MGLLASFANGAPIPSGTEVMQQLNIQEQLYQALALNPPGAIKIIYIVPDNAPVSPKYPSPSLPFMIFSPSMYGCLLRYSLTCSALMSFVSLMTSSYIFWSSTEVWLGISPTSVAGVEALRCPLKCQLSGCWWKLASGSGLCGVGNGLRNCWEGWIREGLLLCRLLVAGHCSVIWQITGSCDIMLPD